MSLFWPQILGILSTFLTLEKEEYFIRENIRQKYQSESVKDPPGGQFSILHRNLMFRVSERKDVCISVYMSKFALVVSTLFCVRRINFLHFENVTLSLKQKLTI